jgi:hypothetical protein
VPASSYIAPRPARRALFNVALATAGLISLLASAVLAKDSEDSYPGSSHVTKAQRGWERYSMKVEKHAPGDEAQSGVTARGTKIRQRGEECFPTYEGNLFGDLDLLRGADGNLSSVFDKAKAKPDDLAGLLPQAIRGQSTWMLWSEGDEAFWGWLLEHNYGFTDFLVLLDSREREHRFRDAGLTNQPGMKAQKDPKKKILGLYLDQIDSQGSPPQYHARNDCALFEPTPEPRYAAALAALATDGADPNVYGYPSGVIGLRLYPNPDFFDKDAPQAREYWKTHVEDQPEDDYYKPESLIAADPNLVRPFRISMTCAFCHIAPHPLNPPKDPEDPKWENLSSTVGAQYWTGSKAFSNLKRPKSFFFQVIQSWQPGTLDTSLLSTDQINNPNTMNAIWNVPARIDRAKLNPPEKQSDANLLLPGIEAPAVNPRLVPRILIDGSDSVGISGALSRVYLNIGAYYEQWTRLHNPIIGFRAQRPFEMTTIKEKSAYWRMTEKYRVPEIAAFLTYENKAGENVTGPMKLANAPGGQGEIKPGEAKKGRAVFLENCAICHSSKQPKGFRLEFSREWRTKPVPGALLLPMEFKDWEEFKKSDPYSEYVNRLGEYVKSLETEARGATSDAFLDHNYLSTDIRIPVTLVGTNSARAVGTNAMRGQVWENFSSEAYKSLLPVGEVHFYNPFSHQPVDEWGNNDVYHPPGGGPGYYRPASLVSIWATAPFLHNNALGRYTHDPSVEGRLKAFDDAVDKLLWKAKRVPGGEDKDHPGDLRAAHKELAGQDPGFIYRTTTQSWIDFPATFIRPLLVGIMGPRVVSILTRYLWYVLAAVAIMFAVVGRQQHAGFALMLIAVLIGVVLRLTRVDTIYPSLWWVPAVAVVLALLLWLGPQARALSAVFFSLLAASFIMVAVVAGAWVDGRLGGVKLGPIPQGTPVNLIMNVNPQAPPGDLLDAVSGLTRGILAVRKNDLRKEKEESTPYPEKDKKADKAYPQKDEEGKALKIFEAEAGSALLKVSKCPDFVLDRGHWFAEGLSDEQKLQLKEFLKTL